MLEMIFSHLQPDSVKTVRLVSRQWKTVVEKPKFWRWAKLRFNRSNKHKVTDSQVVHLVAEILLCEEVTSHHLGDLLRRIGHFKQLKKLDFERTITRRPDDSVIRKNVPVSSRVLCSALVQVDEFSIEKMTRYQASCLLEKIASTEKIKLRRLDLGDTYLPSAVSTDILVKAICRLETVRASYNEFTAQEISAIFRAVAEGAAPRLRELSVCGNDLSALPAEVLAMAMTKVEMLDVVCTELTTKQLECLWQVVAQRKQGRLKSLWCSNYDDHLVPRELVRRGRANTDVRVVGSRVSG